jgi:glycosyltransferase involved in cell wall biosynthesis
MGVACKLPLIKNKNEWPWREKFLQDNFDCTINWPKISIVTPTFNQGKYIEETIRSVLLQNYPNLEYIIIDGGSTDETIDIIKKYEPWLSYWVSEPDKGQSHAINKGLEKCTGDIFNWLNSDDWYFPYTLHEVAINFIKNPELKVVSGFENHVTQDGMCFQHRGAFLQPTLEQTIEACHISQPSTFFKLADLKQIGQISEDLHYLMDGEMWQRFLLLHGQTNFLKIEKELVNFRYHTNSKTVNYENSRFYNERKSIIISLQQYVCVPDQVRDFWMNEYLPGEIVSYNSNWNFNPSIINKKNLRLYFIKKFINLQFHRKSLEQARWGINELIRSRKFDLFLIKSVLKVFVKR